MRELVLVLVPIAVLGCAYQVSEFRGDGMLVDHGPAEATPRYVLDLGPIEASEAVYVFENLPPRELTLGLEVTGPEGECVHDTTPIDSEVTSWLVNLRGDVVMAETAPLHEWVWSGSVECDRAFVYRKGVSRTVGPAGQASTRERIELKTDSGWGTYFTPRRSARYRLRVKISDPEPAPYKLRLKAESAGRK